MIDVAKVPWHLKDHGFVVPSLDDLPYDTLERIWDLVS